MRHSKLESILKPVVRHSSHNLCVSETRVSKRANKRKRTRSWRSGIWTRCREKAHTKPRTCRRWVPSMATTNSAKPKVCTLAALRVNYFSKISSLISNTTRNQFKGRLRMISNVYIESLSIRSQIMILAMETALMRRTKR